MVTFSLGLVLRLMILDLFEPVNFLQSSGAVGVNLSRRASEYTECGSILHHKGKLDTDL